MTRGKLTRKNMQIHQHKKIMVKSYQTIHYTKLNTIIMEAAMEMKMYMKSRCVGWSKESHKELSPKIERKNNILMEMRGLSQDNEQQRINLKNELQTISKIIKYFGQLQRQDGFQRL